MVPGPNGTMVQQPGTLKAVRGIGWFIPEYGCAQVSMNLVDLDTTPLHAAFDAAGLEAAHEQGIVHRDLKPANIMVEPETGESYIMDFGIARSATPTDREALESGVRARKPKGGDSGETQAGGLIGTLQYMAPEQFAGKDIDQRADIYSFGLIFYDILVGRQRSKGAESAFAEHALDEAIDYANRAIRIEDREYRFYYTLAQLQYRTGHESRARLNLRKAIRLAPEWVDQGSLVLPGEAPGRETEDG